MAVKPSSFKKFSSSYIEKFLKDEGIPHHLASKVSPTIKAELERTSGELTEKKIASAYNNLNSVAVHHVGQTGDSHTTFMDNTLKLCQEIGIMPAVQLKKILMNAYPPAAREHYNPLHLPYVLSHFFPEFRNTDDMANLSLLTLSQKSYYSGKTLEHLERFLAGHDSKIKAFQIDGDVATAPLLPNYDGFMKGAFDKDAQPIFKLVDDYREALESGFKRDHIRYLCTGNNPFSLTLLKRLKKKEDQRFLLTAKKTRMPLEKISDSINLLPEKADIPLPEFHDLVGQVGESDAVSLATALPEDRRFLAKATSSNYDLARASQACNLASESKMTREEIYNLLKDFDEKTATKLAKEHSSYEEALKSTSKRTPSPAPAVVRLQAPEKEELERKTVQELTTQYDLPKSVAKSFFEESQRHGLNAEDAKAHAQGVPNTFLVLLKQIAPQANADEKRLHYQASKYLSTYNGNEAGHVNLVSLFYRKGLKPYRGKTVFKRFEKLRREMKEGEAINEALNPSKPLPKPVPKLDSKKLHKNLEVEDLFPNVSPSVVEHIKGIMVYGLMPPTMKTVLSEKRYGKQEHVFDRVEKGMKKDFNADDFKQALRILKSHGAVSEKFKPKHGEAKPIGRGKKSKATEKGKEVLKRASILSARIRREGA